VGAKGSVTISKQDYFDLRFTEEKMRLLEAGGIDNWEWYGESLHPDDGETLNDVEAQLRKEILGE